MRFVGHDGGTMSFFSVLLVSPEKGLGVFVSYDGGAALQALSDLFRTLARRYLPTQPPDTSPFTAHPEDAGATAGVYQNSRRADSTIARLSALTSELLISPAADAMVTIHSAAWPFLAGQSLQEVGELLYRDANGGEIAFEQVSKRVMRVNMGAAQQWQRVPWYLDIRIVGPAVVASVLVSVLTVVSWPIAAIIRRWGGRLWSEDVSARRCHLTARLILILQLAVIAAVSTLFTVATLNPTILSNALDPTLVALYACAWLGSLGGLLAVWIAWQFWRNRMSGRWARIHHSLIAVSAVTLAWFFLTWHIAGTTLNY
jgi:hypothetical protein